MATLQPDGGFGRILAAYGGVLVAGSIAWGTVRVPHALEAAGEATARTAGT